MANLKGPQVTLAESLAQEKPISLHLRNNAGRPLLPHFGKPLLRYSKMSEPIGSCKPRLAASCCGKIPRTKARQQNLPGVFFGKQLLVEQVQGRMTAAGKPPAPSEMKGCNETLI